MHVSQKNFSAAEQHYLDCFAMLEPVCGLDDPQVLDTVRRYVEIVNKGKKDTSKSVAAAKWREMSHESLPDKVTLGELLKGSRMVSERDLTASWQYSKETKIPLGRAFVDLKLITEKQLQMTLRAQLLVRNNEINAQLGIWLLLYATQLDLELDEVLELFQCVPRTQSPLADELKAASDKIQELEARLPPSHPDLAFAHAKQARFYFYRQQYVEADHHYKRGLEILSANSDVAAESLIELLDHYAQVKLALDDLPETVRLTKMAVQIRSKYYGNESVPYAKGVEKLAQVFCGAGDHHTAISIYQRALDVREKLYGPEDVEILPCLELKAECLVHENDLELAETMLDRCLALAQKEFGKQNAKTERIAKKLADVCKSLGKADKAKSIMPSQLKKNTLQLRKDNLF
jgi:tetratricopeptide (TPR) repeat protein